MWDAPADNKIYRVLAQAHESGSHKFHEMCQKIFADSDLRLAKELAPKKRTLSQIKLALRDNQVVSLEERMAISSGQQNKQPKKSSFSDTYAAGPPLDGGNGFQFDWPDATVYQIKVRLGLRLAGPPLDGGNEFQFGWPGATEQPKIKVGTQHAQTCQNKTYLGNAGRQFLQNLGTKG